MNLSGKTIVIGITGGIAAYKTPDLVSQLKKKGARVIVALSESAEKFVSPLSLEVMSGNKVFTLQKQGEEIDHIKLADEADLVLIAPATANALAKMVTGISDEIIYDLVLATKAPILIAPAMNTNMWEHVSTKRNIEVLKSMDYQIINPESGELACGHIGEGRLADLNKIISTIEAKLDGKEAIANRKKPQAATEIATQSNTAEKETEANSPKSIFFNNAKEKPGQTVSTSPIELESIDGLRGKKVVITVGATREQIDPVRFITNRSSGKMGFALAKEAVKQGADVFMISTIECSEAWASDLHLIKVESHEDMYQAIFREFTKSNPYSRMADALIMVAAVADYRPKLVSSSKIKKTNHTPDNEEASNPLNKIVNMINQANEKSGDISIELEKTPDILEEIGRIRQANQVIVGFSVETENLIENSKTKVEKKNLDFIVANKPSAFAADYADVSILCSKRRASTIPMITNIPKESKAKIAHQILDYAAKCLKASPVEVGF
jgi:phosphopantothenoylcysteine decarboxylase/phosphopantothenate--cysteine ligase